MRGRRAKCESKSWRRISKPWHREPWKERQSWKGKMFYFFFSLALLLVLLWVFCGPHVGLQLSVTKSVCVQDEGKSKEGWSSEKRRGEWEKEPAGHYNSEHAVCHNKTSVSAVCFFYISFSLPICVIYFLSFRPNWNRQKLNSEVCLRSSRAWGLHWHRGTQVSCSSKAPSPPSPRNSPLPTGKRSEIRGDVIERRVGNDKWIDRQSWTVQCCIHF